MSAPSNMPDALQLAGLFAGYEADHTSDGWPAIRQRHLSEAAALLRTQHVDIERKDALLRQALEALRLAVDDDYLLPAVCSMAAITKELQ